MPCFATIALRPRCAHLKPQLPDQAARPPDGPAPTEWLIDQRIQPWQQHGTLALLPWFGFPGIVSSQLRFARYSHLTTDEFHALYDHYWSTELELHLQPQQSHDHDHLHGLPLSLPHPDHDDRQQIAHYHITLQVRLGQQRCWEFMATHLQAHKPGGDS